MLDKLPPVYDPYEVIERLRGMGMLSSMVIFLRQELDRMQKVKCFKIVFFFYILVFSVRNPEVSLRFRCGFSVPSIIKFRAVHFIWYLNGIFYFTFYSININKFC